MIEGKTGRTNGVVVYADPAAETGTGRDKLVRLIACGDTGPVRNLERAVLDKGPEHVVGEFAGLRSSADIFFLNLEATFSSRGRPLNRTPVFRLDPLAFSVVRQLAPSVVNLANNHMFDHGFEAFADTCALLRGSGIAYFGAGSDLAEACRPAILDVKGQKFGFIGFRDCEEPGFDHNGVVTPELHRDLMEKAVRDLRPQVDWLVLSLHIGFEYVYYPSPQDVAMCRGMIDAGADLVLCHHPHYPQGVEIYKSRPIAYSLGNFLWDQNFFRHTKASFALVVDMVGNRIVRVEMLPTELSREYSLKIGGNSRLLEFLDGLSRGVRDKNQLESQWYVTCRNKAVQLIQLFLQICRQEGIRKAVKLMRPRLRKPRLRYALKSLAGAVFSGRAFAYEIQRRRDRFRSDASSDH